jgi:hypothetical protein
MRPIWFSAVIVGAGWVAIAPDHTGNTLSDTPDPLPIDINYLRSMDITATLDGGDIEVVREDTSAPPAEGGTAVARSDDRGRAEFKLVPRSHVAELNLKATADGATGSFAGTLPVVAGAIWLDPSSRSSGQLRILAPVARPSVYAMLATRSARWWGASVALAIDSQGFFGASVPWPAVDLPAGEEAWLTLAGDPEGRGPGTVGWPVAAGEDRWGAAEAACPEPRSAGRRSPTVGRTDSDPERVVPQEELGPLFLGHGRRGPDPLETHR